MFQTELNHYLQSFASDELTFFMRFITALGYEGFLLAFLFIILLAVDYKKGFLLVMIFLWTAAITFFFKDYFDLPRPFHVDNTLELLDGELPDEASFDFSKRGATTFWGGLPEDVLSITRQAKGVENGFPSGHSSIAIVLWGALALLFRKRWISIISISLMILAPLSRMYLGVHFLADILGGIALGGIILGLSYLMVLRPDRLSSFVKKQHYQIGFNNISLLLLASPLVLLPLVPIKYYMIIAFIWSFGIGFLLLSQKGLPTSSGSLLERIGRTVIGILTFAAIGFLLSKIGDLTGLGENEWIDFISKMITGLALMWLAIEVCIKIGWFKRSKIV